MIQVPKEMIPMMSSSLVVGKRVADSVILPGSCIMGGRHKQLPRGSRTYWALLRVTELSDNTIVHELLKALELDDDFENMATGDCAREQETSGTVSEVDTPDNPSVLNSEN
uniref:Uncharacterized protein n=2 Tax=Lygus hesperus TaxID=30085 RepID=A0A0K8SMT5_LYGHE